MYHKLIIVGHLGTDPEMRYTPEGTPVTSFRMASHIRYRDANGEQREETIWFRVSIFGRQAEIANQYLQKGRAALVEGRLRPDPETGGPRIFRRSDGTAGASYEVRADRIAFIGPRPEGAPEAVEGEETGAEETSAER
ncbi:MAG: single-stranded DNA-binding protein [Armatimonadota bacterium]|nr:single-stranded DNA-binding protein [Armatimonadota bacterium]MDR7574244.1 single-stranded DNA-binding protein [Armatimonadota bacterium]